MSHCNKMYPHGYHFIHDWISLCALDHNRWFCDLLQIRDSFATHCCPSLLSVIYSAIHLARTVRCGHCEGKHLSEWKAGVKLVLAWDDMARNWGWILKLHFAIPTTHQNYVHRRSQTERTMVSIQVIIRLLQRLSSFFFLWVKIEQFFFYE